MIANNAYNRSVIAEFLDSISEDEFIDEIIIPLFSKHGYLLFRRNLHGPGEHGKDLVFYRHVKLFFDSEYIVVQAKAEKVNAANINKFADQLVRALKVPFPGKSKGLIHPNYVLFINSHQHTNDANFEFHYLTDMKDNIKILSRENIVEQIIEASIIPGSLKDKIELYESSSGSPIVGNNFEEKIRDIILSGNNPDINKLLDNDLMIDSRPLSKEMKALIVNYIFRKWEDDPTWEGTVKPMSWLKNYFDFIQPEQSPKLEQVVREYVSSHHSFDAYMDTSAVMYKIQPTQISTFQDRFIDIAVGEFRNDGGSKHSLLRQKFMEFVNSGLMNERNKNIKNDIIEFLETRQLLIHTTDEEDRKPILKKYQTLDSKLAYFQFPDFLKPTAGD